METTYRLKASELTLKIIEGIKAIYGDKEIEIIISELDETDYLFKSQANRNRLLSAINNVNNGKNLVEVNLSELE